MNANMKNAVVGLATLIFCALCALGWFSTMHQVWQQERSTSGEAKADPFLAASLLLRGNGFATSTVTAIDHVDARKLPDGTLVLGGEAGVISSAKSKQLLAWVARGNTLVFQPRKATPDEVTLSHELLEAAADEEMEEDETADSPAPEPEAAETAEAQENVAEDAPKPIVIDALSEAFSARTEHVHSRFACSNLAGPVDLTKLRTKPPADQDCPTGTIRAHALRQVELPGMGAVTIDAGMARLIDLDLESAPQWSDNRGDAVRGYHLGKGQVVMARVDMFTNTGLRQHDHGALLLGLARINGAHKFVTIVKSRSFVPWYELLWVHYKKMLLALAAVAALLFWRAVRRFGPALPDPVPERRSLMEHIDASGAWLWKARGGRHVLIDAARADLLATLQRREPAVLRMHETQQQDELARRCGVPAADVAHALHHEPARLDTAFTRQIRTLHILRKHYER